MLRGDVYRDRRRPARQQAASRPNTHIPDTNVNVGHPGILSKGMWSRDQIPEPYSDGYNQRWNRDFQEYLMMFCRETWKKGNTRQKWAIIVLKNLACKGMALIS